MPTSIRLTADVEQRLNFLSEKTGRTKAFYLREIIDNGLADIEDYYLASDILKRVRSGQEATHLLENVRGDLGLDD